MSQLHFPGPNGDLSTFPESYELKLLRDPNPRSYLKIFASAAASAKTRLWVLDLHYHPEGHAGIVHALRRAKVTDVRILSESTKNRGVLEAELRAAREMAWGAGQSRGARIRIPGTLEWRDRLYKDGLPYPHDRFVILDDTLWHFGFAAGGSGRCLSAASGPWNAAQHRALDFFEEVWLSVR